MKLWKKIRMIIALFSPAATTLYASSSCYYLIISFVPTTLLAISFFSHFPVTTDWIEQLFPSHVYQVLRTLTDYIRVRDSIGFISFSGFVTIWSASKGILSVRKGLNHAMMSQSSKSFIYERLRSICILVPLFLLCFAIVLFNSYGFHIIQVLLPGIAITLSKLLEYRLILSWFILFVVFTVIYRFVPSAPQRFRCCAVGGAVTSITWQALTMAFSFYMEFISSYRTTYGLLGVLLLAVVWLQFSIQLLLFGGRFIYLISTDQFHPLQILLSSDYE